MLGKIQMFEINASGPNEILIEKSLTMNS